MLLGRVSGQPFDALLDHADGPRGRSCVRGPPPPRRRAFRHRAIPVVGRSNEGEATRLPYYMLQAAYTPEAWAGMATHPQNRLDVVRPVIEKLGGTIERGWLAFGEYDIVLVCELPSNVSEEAFSMAASAGGAVKAVKTTTLMTLDEAMRDNAESQRGRLPARSSWRKTTR